MFLCMIVNMLLINIVIMERVYNMILFMIVFLNEYIKVYNYNK